MINTLNVEQTTDLLLKVCDTIVASKDHLTEVDSVIGDGDHGIGMSGGMQKAADALRSKRPFANVIDVFKTTGMTMLNSMGGASGVIFGSLFMGGLKGLEPATELTAPLLTTIMRGALDSIKMRGKASVGDKTMVDALEPAVQAMEAYDADDLVELLVRANDAANAGLEATKDLVAKFGRAKSLGERARGHQDAGATSVAIIFGAMTDYVSALDA